MSLTWLNIAHLFIYTYEFTVTLTKYIFADTHSSYRLRLLLSPAGAATYCQVYHLARLVGKVVRFQHRGTHWRAAPLYHKQRNQSGLNNWHKCLELCYTSNLNWDILLKAKWTVSFCWLPPVLTFNCDGDLKKAFNECLGASNVFPTTA